MSDQDQKNSGAGFDASSATPNGDPVRIDPERLAALIDGRLSKPERDALLAELDQSPAAMEVFADAVGALPPQDSANSAPHVSSTGAPADRLLSRRAWQSGLVIALAAVLAIAIVPLVGQSMKPEEGLPLTQILAARAPLPATGAMLLVSPWTEVRGIGDILPASGRAVRLGARIVAFDVLVRMRDTTAGRVSREIARLLDEFPGGSIAAAEFRSMAGAPIDSITGAQRERSAELAEQAAGPSHVRAGAWLQVALVAAAVQDSAFFRSAATHKEFAAMQSLALDNSRATGALARLAGWTSPAPLDWSAIEPALTEALRVLASP